MKPTPGSCVFLLPTQKKKRRNSDFMWLPSLVQVCVCASSTFSGVFLVLIFTSDNVGAAQHDRKVGVYFVANFQNSPSGKTYLVPQFARSASISSSSCSLTPLLRGPRSVFFDFRFLTTKIRCCVITSFVGKEGRPGTTRPSQHPAFVAVTLS